MNMVVHSEGKTMQQKMIELLKLLSQGGLPNNETLEELNKEIARHEEILRKFEEHGYPDKEIMICKNQLDDLIKLRNKIH